MNRINFTAVIIIIGIAPLSMLSWSVTTEKVPLAEKLPLSSETLTHNYNHFIRMGTDEMEATNGKVGPIIAGAATGVIVGIAGAYGSDPNNSPSNVNVIAGAVGGGVGGGLYPVMGPVASGLIGVSVAGGINDVFGGGSGGVGGCYSNGCHGGTK